MATFSKASYNAVKYAAARPTYPRQLFDFIYRYHERGPDASDTGNAAGSLKARWDTALDLGCGTGQATLELSAFKRVIGVDPSAKMIKGAKEYISASIGSPSTPQYEFIQSPAEELSFLEDASVDLVISAQAAHWFDWSKLWPELARILRKNGTVAYWGYSQMRLANYPTLTPLINDYQSGTNPETSLGPHWEQPGRSILDNHLIDVPRADNVVPGAFHHEERIYFTGSHYPTLPRPLPIIMRKKMTWELFETYLRSYSSLNNFIEKHPGDSARADGDIVTRFIRTLKEEMKKVDEKGQLDVTPTSNATPTPTTTASATAESSTSPNENTVSNDNTSTNATSTNATSNEAGFFTSNEETQKNSENNEEVNEETENEDSVELEWPLALVLVKRT